MLREKHNPPRLFDFEFQVYDPWNQGISSKRSVTNGKNIFLSKTRFRWFLRKHRKNCQRYPVSLFHILCHFHQGFSRSDLSTISSKVVCIHAVIKLHRTKKIYHFPCVEWSMLKLWITGLWSMKSIEHKFYAFGYWLHFTVQRDFSTEYLNGDQSMWIFLRCWMSVENAAENLQYQTLKVAPQGCFWVNISG